ncbi:hypothetical protein EC960428_2224, partial [Escherichia coli 96.0428]
SGDQTEQIGHRQ